MGDDPNRLRQTFERAAHLYHHARPAYPVELLNELEELAGLRPGDHLLEVGCATGTASVQLAERGYRLTCIELGSELAKVAAQNLASYPQVEVVHSDFETYRPDRPRTFDLVFAATAWHWVDPKHRYQKAHALIRPGGHLAFWSALQVFPDDADPFFREIQSVYNEIREGLDPKVVLPRPGELPVLTAEVEASGLFDKVKVRHFDWEIQYDAESYIALLNTFSGHIAMQPWQRQRLYSEIRRRLSQRHDGLVRRHWGAVLHVAERRD